MKAVRRAPARAQNCRRSGRMCMRGAITSVQEILLSCVFLLRRIIVRDGGAKRAGDRARRARDARQRLDDASRRALRRPQDSLFFRCAVVINVQCSSIRDCAASPVSSSWLGGQNGEEVKVEDEVRCEEDRSQDREAEGRTQEGEVTPRRREGLRTGEDPIAQSARPQAEALCTAAPRRFKSTKEGVGEIEVALPGIRIWADRRAGIMLPSMGLS
jgi:hypothetical protein